MENFKKYSLSKDLEILLSFYKNSKSDIMSTPTSVLIEFLEYVKDEHSKALDKSLSLGHLSDYESWLGRMIEENDGNEKYVYQNCKKKLNEIFGKE